MNTATVQSRYQKVQVLVSRGATDGERSAARAAAYRMWKRHTVLRRNVLGTPSTAGELRATLENTWDHANNTFLVSFTELDWELRELDTDILQGALDMVQAELRAGWRAGNGTWKLETSVKKLNLLEHALEWVLR